MELGGVNERHEDVADVGAALASVEERAFAISDGHLEGSLGDVVVEGGTWFSQEERELLPALEKVVEGLPEVGVGLDAFFSELGRHAGADLLHEGGALGLVGEQALLVRGAARLAFVVEFVDEGESLEDEAALDGVVVELVDDLASAVGDAVGVDDLVTHGQVAGEGVAHLDGRREVCGALVEHEGEVFAGVFSAGEEEGDGADVGDDGDDGGGEEARALGVGELTAGEELRAALSHEVQDADVAVVVVQDLALCGGAEELVVGGLDEGDALVYEVPLRGGRQGRVEVSLKLVEPVEGHAKKTTSPLPAAGRGRGWGFRGSVTPTRACASPRSRSVTPTRACAS